MERHILRPGPNDCGKRIDRILRVCFPAAGLGALFAALRRGEISVNGKKVSQSYRVAHGDEISVKKTSPFLAREAPSARGLPLPAEGGKKTAGASFSEYIIFEDENFLALNKPWGRLSHGPGSLAEEAAAYLAPVLPPSLAFFPGPLHRLDRNTTGLIFFSKSLEGARAFSAALRAGSIRKTYYALLEGRIKTRQTWTDELVRDTKRRVTRAAPETPAGKTALSEVRPLAAARGLSLCEFVIRTGRTHQIRAQAAAHGHPLAGDRKYGGGPLAGAPHGGYILHAAEILLPPGFPGKASRLRVRAPLSADAEKFLREAGFCRNPEK